MAQPPPDDPLRQRSRASVRRIGIQVAVVCAGLVCLGGGAALAYLAWQLSPTQQAEAPDQADVRLSLDPSHLVVAAVILGVFAIASAGVAAWFIARRAVRPLDAAARAQQRFVADASHELRTPLAVMGARAQQLAAMIDDDDPRRAVAEDLRTDVTVMADIVDDMLVAARDGRPEPATCEVAPVLARAGEDLAVFAAEAGVTVEAASVEATAAIGAARLRRCLVALLDNAVAHAPDGSVVRVDAAAAADAVVFRVADHGSGIRGIDPAHVFDRFAHGEAPRRPGRTSAGIGLSLVAEIAASVDGDVRVERTSADGTVMRLRIPRAERRTT